MIRAFSYSFVGVIVVAFAFLIFVALFSCPSSGGKRQRVKADFQSISHALESYRTTTGDYPTTDQGLMAMVGRPKDLTTERAWKQIATQVPIDPWKNEYRYRLLADKDPRGFELRMVGPDGIEGNDDDRVSK